MAIVKRADEMGIMMFDRISLLIDLEIAHNRFNLRLRDLLEADKFNFAHDIVGIQNHINRTTKEMQNNFLPIYVSK